MSNPNQDEGSSWSLDLTPQASQTVQQLYQAMANKHAEEMSVLKQQYEMWQVNRESYFEQQFTRLAAREEAERERTVIVHGEQIREIRAYHD